MKHMQLSNDEIIKIQNLRKEGFTYNEIKEITHISINSIMRYSKDILIESEILKETKSRIKNKISESAEKVNTEANLISREYMHNRYYDKKSYYINMLGGECVKCGNDKIEDLEFDHILPENKEFTISKIWSFSEIKVLSELSKCQILCHDCHIKKSFEEDNHTVHSKLRHGTLSSHRYCRCDECKKSKNEYMREWRKKNKDKL